MKGGALTCAAIFAFLTCALAYDPKILQVTERRHVGTAAELRFQSFIQEHGKVYPTRAEYLHRLAVFAENLVRAAEHQLLDPTAKHGVTQFSDLTPAEFEGMYMGVRGGAAEVAAENGVAAEEVDAGDLPESFDWREKGAVTDVKMQVNYFTPSVFFRRNSFVYYTSIFFPT